MNNSLKKRTFYDLITPEGATLSFQVSTLSDRFTALMIDLIFIILIIVVISMLLIPVGLSSGALGTTLFYISFFLIRNFYFLFFELFWKGRTPGKRAYKLQIINMEGETLSNSAIIVRNLTREGEILLPLSMLMAPHYIDRAGATGVIMIIAIGWMTLFGCIIFFNKQRRRAGDLAAGTIVVKSPQKIALEDINTIIDQTDLVQVHHEFGQEHLTHYGEYELQKLEYILRHENKYEFHDTLDQIADQIQKKVGWKGTRKSDMSFLQDFYTAQRHYLEKNMLFGKRRKDKYDTLKENR